MQEEAEVEAGRAPRRANSFARKTETGVPPGQPSQHREGREDIAYEGTRNRRSVWTVPTKPYSGAHFAVFPPELIEPCILAGSRPGDLVLDPFMGSGTTAQVAQALGRQWIGCELNPEYAPLQAERTAQGALAL
jgi:site-specific DNA-methyltransferase (cytosine-N4-specific)